MTDENRETPFESAAGEIRDAVRRRAGSSGVAVIGITGPVGAGKTTLARSLASCVLSTDDYLPDYDRVAEHLRDEPEMSDLASLAVHLGMLRRGLPAEVPVWSFRSHRREGVRVVWPPAPSGDGSSIIVCEGLHALHTVVRPSLDVSVYVDAPASDRWARWERLEVAGVRGWGVEAARRYFDTVAEPAFQRRTAEYRAAASFVVRNPLLGLEADRG